ncbi:hypothetical protein [Malonomonas rubra]|uniref:hypothetical protein n=1 Tax=Malonomonas rubra TaxID=57040 RepID=UPI0026EF3097|nr:hypothetical protein [Malonomonas rubra]
MRVLSRRAASADQLICDVLEFMLPANRYIKSLILLSSLLCLLLGSGGVGYAGDPFGFIGNWNYRENGGDAVDSTSQLNHSYSLTYMKDLSAAMAFSGSVRYSETLPSEGTETRSLNPSLSFDARSDLFSLNLNASESRSEQEGTPERVTDAWGVNLSSQMERWPSVRFYFNQSFSTDDSQPKQIDNNTQTSGASIEYGYSVFDFLYDVRHSLTTDDIQNSETENLDQTAQVSYAQTFWQGRVTIAASQQYQTTENEVSSVAPIYIVYPSTSGLFGTQAEFGALTNTTDVDGLLATNLALIDGDKSNSAGVDVFDNRFEVRKIAIQVDREDIRRLELYLDRELNGDNTQLTFKVFQSDDGENWSYLSNSPTFPLDINDRQLVRFELPTGAKQKYLMVAVKTNSTFPAAAHVTEIEASTFEPGRSRDTTTLQTQFNGSVRLSDNWTVSYSLRRAETQLDSGDTVQLNQSLISSYRLNEKVGFSFGVSENTDSSDNSADQTNRSYSVAMATQPLSSVNFSLGYTHSDNSSDDGRDKTTDAVHSTLNAAIYPDLTASLSTNWSQSEDNLAGSETNNFGATFNTTAYLSPKTDLNTSLSYTESDSSDGETSRSETYGVTFGYRPSDMLLFNLSFDGDLEEDTSSLSGSSNWIWSRKLQSQFGFSFDFGDDTSQQYNGLLSWLISRSLSMQSSANYMVADEGNGWNINASFNMIF